VWAVGEVEKLVKGYCYEKELMCGSCWMTLLVVMLVLGRLLSLLVAVAPRTVVVGVVVVGERRRRRRAHLYATVEEVERLRTMMSR
jgi:hypothetical protein